MIGFIIASYVKDTGCTALARQIARYCAAGGNRTVLVTESSLYDRLKETATEYKTLSPHDSIPEDTDITVYDYGDASDKVIKEDSADRIYLVTDAGRVTAESLGKRFNSTPYECQIVLFGTNDMSEYKKLGQKVIKTAGIENGECQYEIRLDLDLFSHQRGFDVPDPSKDFKYEPLTDRKKKEDNGSGSSGKKDRAPGIAGIPFFRKGGTAEKAEEQKTVSDNDSKAMPDKGEGNTTRKNIREDRTDPAGIEYEDGGSVKDKLSSLASGASGAAAAIAKAVGKKKDSGYENKAKKTEEYPDVDGKKPDWSKKTHDVEAQTKNVGHIFSAVNALLILSIVVMAIFTFLAFRDSKHTMVTNKELVKTTFPVRVETDGVSVSDYSGVAKNRKVAVVIGDDEFVKPYNKTFQKLEKKEAVETRKYEIDVTYSDNPLLQTFFGTLKFVHHSAFGEGEFSKKEVAEIMDYSRKWFSKKRYDFFGFNDKDTINVNDAPDSLLRETD